MTEPTETTATSEIEPTAITATSESTKADDIAQHMTVAVERVSDIERKVSVGVAWEQVKGQLDEAYRELQQGVAIKGFRRGKVPRRMLEQLFGKHVTKEVAQRLVQESMARAFTNEALAPVSEPVIVDEGIKEGVDFRYTATVQVVPEINPQDYFDVEVRRRPARISDEDVEQALQQKQREMTDFRAIEGRSTQAGDVVLVDIMGKVGADPIDRQQELVELGDPPHEPLPGLAAKLTGVAPGTEELELELEVPTHSHGPGEPCPGDEPKQKARLLVTIRDMKQKVVPALDDDFARDTNEAQTLVEYRAVLRRKLLEQDEQRAVQESRGQLLEELTRRNDVPHVPALVEKQLEQTVRMQLTMLGIDPDDARIPLDSLKEKMRDEATKTVRGTLLLEAIAKKEKIDVLDSDVEQRLAQIASARSQNVARVRSEYEKENRLAALRAGIRQDKTLDLLMSKAKILVEEKPTDAGTTAAPSAAK